MNVEKFINLPNYCNGKLYKHWDSVTNLFGNSAILATKTDKNGKNVQLLIIDGGKKKRLYNEVSEIMDEIDIDGIKRTYSYKRQSDGNTVATMSVQNNLPEDKKPFIIFAKWISKELKPIVAELKFNSNHPKSRINITERIDDCNVVKIYTQHFVDAKIEEFKGSGSGGIFPGKVTFKTPNGEEKIISGGYEETKSYVKQLELNSGHPNIQHMSLIV